MSRRMQGLMTEEGLPYCDRTMTYNSRLAQELAKWAESNGKGDEIHGAIFGAYFAKGKNIGKRQVLLEIAQDLGLPVAEAEVVLEKRSYQEAVDHDWQRCAQLGITGVPTFVINSSALVGAYPYEDLEKLVRKAS